MTKFREWYIDNWQAITWCLIIVLGASTVVSFYKGDYATAATSFFMAGINYVLGKPFK